MAIELIWTKCSDSDQSTKRIFWDFGDKRWDLRNNYIVHYKILSRKVISKEPFTLLEEVRELPEEPVPLEAEIQVATGWSVTERLIKSEIVSLENKKQQPIKQTLPLLPNPVQHQQVKSESVEEELSLYSLNLPTELWLSLSQWIPTNALFQPSLHHQATAELCEQRTSTYLRPQPMTHRYAKHPKHVPLTVSGQKNRVDYFAKPLFI